MVAQGSGATSVPVMADAQFGNVRVLLPFENFEDDYQDRSGSVMIAFPGGLDPNAGQPGFDDKLILGHPVPRGARVSIGIPVVFDNIVVDYRYAIVFRDRTLRDYRSPGANRIRPPFHYAKQALGAVDGTVVGSPGRYPIDARYWTIGYEQAEPQAVAANVFPILNLYPELVIPKQILFPQCLVSGGNAGTVQQGIYDPTQIGPSKVAVLRCEFQVDCNGDDMIVFAQKIPDEEGEFSNWDFDGEDAGFSNFYGRGGYAAATHDVYEDAGIRVTTGTNP
jgi:hypothetical protein